MRYAKLAFLTIGILLLWLVLREADLDEIWRQARNVSVVGLVGMFLIYTVYFGADVVSWQVTMESVPMTLRWARRLFVVRMIGEAYNNVTPMASMGGEPVKAWLLKANYGIPLRDSGASLILAKTASMFSLVLFVAVAIVLVFSHEKLSQSHRLMAGLALAWLTFNVVVFFLMQHLKLSTFTATRLGRTRLGERLSRLLAGMHAIDEQFARFYRYQRKRLILSMAYAMLNWVVGVGELYYVLLLIGHPIAWWDAWLIAAMVQLIRTAVFFIPAGLGALEATMMLVYGAIAGNPTPGITAALILRFRELVWTSLSLAIAAGLHVSPRSVAADRTQPKN